MEDHHLTKKIKIMSIVLCFICGLILIFNKEIGHLIIKENKVSISQKIVLKNQNNNDNSEFDWTKSNSLSTSDIVKAKLSKKNYIGLISIPEININLPISPGVSNNSLSLGAGTMYKNQQMGRGNYSLASHFVQGNSNKNMLFSPLYYTGSVGQTIFVTDLKNIYEYISITVKIVPPSDVGVTEPVPGKKLITLITCDYTAENGRVIMQGKLVKKISWQQAPLHMQQYFEKKFEIL